MNIKLRDKNRKPCIGILFGNYHSDHPRRLLRHLYSLFSKEDVELRFYLGTESSSFLTDFGVMSNSYDYQYASFYGMSRYDDLDLLIVSLGTLVIYQEWLTTEGLIASLPDVPMILLENEDDIPGSIWVVPDNFQGMCDCTEHLITRHDFKNILFLTGPEGNFESRERLRGYLETMNKHGLEVRDGMIGHGDFSENVDDIVDSLLDANPGAEAIVSSNDEMAFAIYRVCAKRGLEVGRDIAVTGFDDAEMAQYLQPPLTTISQDYESLSRCAYEKAMALIRGEEAESERVRAPFILRASCGCPAAEEAEKEADDVDERNEMLKARRERSDFRQDVYKSTLLLREMVPETADVKEFMASIGRFLASVNVRNSYICLFDNPKKNEKGAAPDFSEPVSLSLLQKGAEVKVFDLDKAPMLSASDDASIHDIVPPGFYISFLLYYEKYQYGLMSVDIDPSRVDFFYLLSLDLGTSFRHLHMSIERERYRAELQALARHDNLTGLYNRLGMAGTAAGYVKVNKDRLLVAMMADLDHLKQINDAFGHSAGDTAICKSASILRKAVGKLAPLGRTGGDEYMGIFAVNSEKDIVKVEKKIHDACNKYNAKSDNPFYVEISVGFHIFNAGEFKDLSSVMEPADLNLYEAKKKRRASVLKQDYQNI